MFSRKCRDATLPVYFRCSLWFPGSWETLPAGAEIKKLGTVQLQAVDMQSSKRFVTSFVYIVSADNKIFYLETSLFIHKISRRYSLDVALCTLGQRTHFVSQPKRPSQLGTPDTILDRTRVPDSISRRKGLTFLTCSAKETQGMVP